MSDDDQKKGWADRTGASGKPKPTVTEIITPLLQEIGITPGDRSDDGEIGNLIHQITVQAYTLAATRKLRDYQPRDEVAEAYIGDHKKVGLGALVTKKDMLEKKITSKDNPDEATQSVGMGQDWAERLATAIDKGLGLRSQGAQTAM